MGAVALVGNSLAKLRDERIRIPASQRQPRSRRGRRRRSVVAVCFMGMKKNYRAVLESEKVSRFCLKLCQVLTDLPNSFTL